jgi:O-antigen ligase
MRKLVAGAMIGLMVLCPVAATVAYGAVSPELAAPVYGMGILLALLWAAKLFFATVVSWKQSPMHWPVLGFAVYAIIRYFTAPVEYEARLELFQVGLCTLVYFATACNFYRQRDRTLLLAVLMALALAEAAYGLWQFATRSKYVLFSHRPAQYQHRASGTFVCPNHLAGFLEIMLGMLLARLVVHKVSKGTVQTSALQKVLIAYIGLMTLVGIVLTLSRAGWLATLVGLLALLFWGDWRLRVMWPRILAGVGCIGVLAIIAFNVAPVRNYITYSLSFDQADAPTGVRDVSLGGRTVMWGSTAKMIVDHPIFGTGPGSWQWVHLKYRNPQIQTHAEYAHNDILNLASDYGLIGFGLVAAAIICFFRHVALLTGQKNSSEQRAFAIGTAIAVITILVHSWFDFNLHILANALLLVTLMGFTVAMEDSEGRFPRTEMKPLPRYALGGLLLIVCFLGVWFIGPAVLADHENSWGSREKGILHYDHSLARYRRAMAWDAKFPEPYADSGDIYRSQSLFRVGAEKREERLQLSRKAIEFYDRSLALNPYQSDVMLREAQLYEKVGENDRALKTYQRAIEVDPNGAPNYNHMGLFYRHIGDEPHAMEAFEKANSLFSDEISVLNLFEMQRPGP